MSDCLRCGRTAIYRSGGYCLSCERQFELDYPRLLTGTRDYSNWLASWAEAFTKEVYFEGPPEAFIPNLEPTKYGGIKFKVKVGEAKTETPR